MSALVLLHAATGHRSALAQDPAAAPVADSGPSGRTLEAPSDPRPARDKFWWSDDWYEKGMLDVPANHEVESREVSYVNPADKTEVPALLFRPKAPGRYPAVLFAHGRRGIDDLTRLLPLRLAARGFVVLAPNAYAARFIENQPVAHDPATEGDIGAGLDYLLALHDVSTTRACLASHTRGGYYTLKSAVTQGRQGKQAACYVSYYPHWQDPRASEADQVYRYAAEVDQLEIPALVMIGEYEQYQRRPLDRDRHCSAQIKGPRRAPHRLSGRRPRLRFPSAARPHLRRRSRDQGQRAARCRLHHPAPDTAREEVRAERLPLSAIRCRARATPPMR